jgi:hypothetical protein
MTLVNDMYEKWLTDSQIHPSHGKLEIEDWFDFARGAGFTPEEMESAWSGVAYSSFNESKANEFKPELQGKTVTINSGEYEGKKGTVVNVGIFSDDIGVNIDGKDVTVKDGEYSLSNEGWKPKVIRASEVLGVESFTGKCATCGEHYEDEDSDSCSNCGEYFDEYNNVSSESEKSYWDITCGCGFHSDKQEDHRAHKKEHPDHEYSGESHKVKASEGNDTQWKLRVSEWFDTLSDDKKYMNGLPAQPWDNLSGSEHDLVFEKAKKYGVESKSNESRIDDLDGELVEDDSGWYWLCDHCSGMELGSSFGEEQINLIEEHLQNKHGIQSKASEDYFEDGDGNVSSVMKYKLVYTTGEDYGYQTNSKKDADDTVEEWNSTFRGEPIKVVSQEAGLYGYGSATGRQSPADHWKQGLDSYGDMGYDSKLSSPVFDEFSHMKWSELPEDIQQAYMAKHDYMDTTQSGESAEGSPGDFRTTCIYGNPHRPLDQIVQTICTECGQNIHETSDGSGYYFTDTDDTEWDKYFNGESRAHSNENWEDSSFSMGNENWRDVAKDLMQEEKKKCKRKGGEVRATEKGETYIFFWNHSDMNYDARAMMLRDAGLDESNATNDWNGLPEDVKDGLKPIMNQMFYDAGSESNSNEYAGQADIDKYIKNIPEIDPTGASSLIPETDFIFPSEWDQDKIDQEASYRLTDDLDWVGGGAYRNKTVPWQDGYESSLNEAKVKELNKDGYYFSVIDTQNGTDGYYDVLIGNNNTGAIDNQTSAYANFIDGETVKRLEVEFNESPQGLIDIINSGAY